MCSSRSSESPSFSYHLLNDAVSRLRCIVSHSRNINEKLEGMLAGICCDLSTVCVERQRKTMVNLSQASHCLGWYFGWAPLEYTSEAFQHMTV